MALRRPIAWLLAMAVPVGAVYGPFLHVHVEGDSDHHHEMAVHAHLSGHNGADQEHDRITVQDAEHDRAVYFQAAVAVAPTLFDVPVAPPPVFGFDAPQERPAHPAVEVTHGHDPPLLDALDSRPPPPFLS